MKRALLVADGAADLPIADLKGRTPLEAADLRNLRRLAGTGQVGLADLYHAVPGRGADTALWGFVGGGREHPGRAAFLLAAARLEPDPGTSAFCLDLVTAADGRIVDASGGLRDAEGAMLFEDLARACTGRGGLRLVHVRGHRGLLLAHGIESAMTHSPELLAGEPWRLHVPSGAPELETFIAEAAEFLAAHDVNRVRMDLGENPANLAWPYGPGRVPAPVAPAAPGTMVSAAPWALGMAAVAGMKTLDAAEDRPQALARAAFEALAAADLVVVHTEAPARASHHGDVREKLEALAHWDRQLVGPVADEIARTGGVLLVAVTSTALAERRVNRDGPTPFLLHGRDVSAPVAPRAFTEAAAGESQLRASGAAALLEHFHRS